MFNQTIIIMKRLFYYALALALCGQVFISCDDEKPMNAEEQKDPNGNNGKDSINNNPPTIKVDGNTLYSVAQQKEFIDSVGRVMLGIFPAANFKDIVSFVSEIAETLEEYDWDDVGDWAESALADCMTLLGEDQPILDDTYSDTWFDCFYYDVYTNYRALILLSNFTGHFTAADNAWTYSDANDLQFIFNDSLGQQCVLALTTSGQVKNVHMPTIEDFQAEDYDYQVIDRKDTYIYTDSINLIDLTIGIPQNITLSLSRGADKIIQIAAAIDLSGIDNGEFNLASSALSGSLSFELNNGYKMETSTSYKNSGPTASYSLSYGKVKLLSASLSADLSGMPSVTLHEVGEDDFDDDVFENANAKNVLVNVDILGSIQIKGKLYDVQEVGSITEEIDTIDMPEKEEEWKALVKELDDQFDLNVYFCGGDTAQLGVNLESFVTNGYDDFGHPMTRWSIKPVITFNDGTSYCFFGDYFDDKSFSKVINAFNSLAESYYGLIGSTDPDYSQIGNDDM